MTGRILRQRTSKDPDTALSDQKLTTNELSLELTCSVTVQNPAANDIMKQQEEMLKQKYGGLQPKKKLMPKVCP